MFFKKLTTGSVLALSLGFISHGVFAECLQIGDSQSTGTTFTKTLNQSLSTHGWKTNTFSKVGSRTLDWIKVPSTPLEERFPIVSYPNSKLDKPLPRQDKSWIQQLLGHGSADKKLDCVVVQLGDNDYDYAKKYIELTKAGEPSKAQAFKEQYLKQVKMLVEQIGEQNPGRCSWIGPTWRDQNGGYKHVSNDVKIMINALQKEALAGTKCEHVDGTDPTLKAEFDKLGSFTKDGLHLTNEAAEKWGQFAANAVVNGTVTPVFEAKKRSADAAPLVKDFKQKNLKEIDVRDYKLPLTNSIKVMSTKTGRTSTLNANRNSAIQVLGKAPGGGYRVRVFKNGVLLPGEFVTAASNVKRGVNWYMLNQFEEVARETNSAGTAGPTVCPECVAMASQRQADYNLEDVSDLTSDAPVVSSPGEWKPGCEALAQNPPKAEDKSKLMQCIRSIQNAIVAGNRDGNGALNRKKVFDSMFSRLKPEEQKFAAMIFTVQGEVGWMGDHGRYHEMMAVMKVLENRVSMAKQRGWSEPVNELDIALHPIEFSMYNANDPNWRKVLDPVRRENFSNAIESFLRFPSAKFEPANIANRISHYHTNGVSPAWRNSPKANLVIDNNPVVGAGRTKHLFYYNVDGNVGWSRRQSSRYKRA